MVKLNKIYTRTGDDGCTGLVRGPRRNKDDLRVAAYGMVEEANASVGQARIHSAGMPKFDTVLARVQNDLFDLGSDLATPGTDPKGKSTLRVTAAQTQWLEDQIDQYNASLSPLTSFILPGGSPLAASLHMARTITRRAERTAVSLTRAEPGTSPETVRYLNRLSDLLFVLSRIANQNGAADVEWQPGRFAGGTRKT